LTEEPRYDLVKESNMVDYVEGLYEQLKTDGVRTDAKGGSGFRQPLDRRTES
jgi:hypothetical protein